MLQTEMFHTRPCLREENREESMDQSGPPTASFYEFFAGGGMARAGLGPHWQCLFANDIDPKKAAHYSRNWGCEELKLGDVAALSSRDLPRQADLVWASFPCQDLSLAGMGAGLNGHRSGTFWPFWTLIKSLRQEGRQPGLIVLENVCGALTSHQGKDFQSILSALCAEEYRYGALTIDAARFVPQSRPRLFIVAVKKGTQLPPTLSGSEAAASWASPALLHAQSTLSEELRRSWVWWCLPAPAQRTTSFSDLVEQVPEGVAWHTNAETQRLIGMMSPVNRSKLRAARRAGQREIGTVYKRTRIEVGERIQRAEARFDGLAGCLRTPGGGSSRQIVLVVEGRQVRSRLLSPREAARLMGLPEEYELPARYNDAYHLIGDGVVVPVVRHLAAHLLEPLLAAVRAERSRAA
jgi:DNA (cytosine-5)-methyltransferase 1